MARTIELFEIETRAEPILEFLTVVGSTRQKENLMWNNLSWPVL
jgi:hypothetical protein